MKLYLAVLLLISVSIPSHADEIKFLTPMQIGEEIDQKKIDSYYERPVIMGSLDRGPLMFRSVEGDPTLMKSVKSCKEYDEFLNDPKWKIYNKYEGIYANFVKTCDAFKIISKSMVSKKSFWSPYNKIPFPLEILSAGLKKSENFCEIERENPICLTGKVNAFVGHITMRAGSSDFSFTPVIQADINNDGFEDIAYFYAFYPKTVKARYGYACVTKLNQDEINIINCME